MYTRLSSINEHVTQFDSILMRYEFYTEVKQYRVEL